MLKNTRLPQARNFWIGMSSATTGWSWTDNSIVDYEPNIAQTRRSNQQLCVAVHYSSGHWVAISCQQVLGAVCKTRRSTNNPNEYQNKNDGHENNGKDNSGKTNKQTKNNVSHPLPQPSNKKPWIIGTCIFLLLVVTVTLVFVKKKFIMEKLYYVRDLLQSSRQRYESRSGRTESIF